MAVFPQKGDNFLYLQRLNPNTLQRYRLEREEPGLSPLSFSASYSDKHIRLLYLCKPEFPVKIFLGQCLTAQASFLDLETKKGAEHSGWHESLPLIADNASQWQQLECLVCRRFAVKDTC